MSKLSININPNPSNPLDITFRGVSGDGTIFNSFNWDFGDGNVANTQVAGNTYAVPGLYLVSLTALSLDGVSMISNWFSFQTTPTLSMPILTVLESKLGQRIFNLFQSNLIQSIQKWQMYLQPQVYPDLDPANTFVESAWPPLWNYLIADLARLDLMLDESALMILQQAAANELSGSTTESSGSIKRIETGPAQVEFYEDSQKNLDDIGAYIRYVFEPGRGMVEQYKTHCCVLAKRLSATLPFCEQEKRNHLYIKSKPC